MPSGAVMEEFLQLAPGRGSWLKMFILKQGPKTVRVCVRDKNPVPHFCSLATFLTPKCICFLLVIILQTITLH